ncbi:hypothetical protein B0I33_106122 [Prauserella shujinwangii]|uniref:PPE family protein n=1 Tax=Prauserella shujinwangii TaxID=1453103 RepID=A0A2T0LTH6_9PSEU|nr:hypothetical protein [Prauserella shujinwangii]PRX47025.1 hypothetical protein B0I33_106122 [Prauserella shujinwangii]
MDDGGYYARLPAMVQYAVGDVEAHTHLAHVERASRMWRAVAEELSTLAHSLRRELDCLRASWKDATGAEFVRRATERHAAVEDVLARILEHRPWLALDDLARQLLLTRARLGGTAEHATADARYVAAEHLRELDRYFLAAADAVSRAAGGHGHSAGNHALRTGTGEDACCAEPADALPTLAGSAGPGLLPSVPLGPGAASPLPPGTLAMPGLVAVPPGSLAHGARPRHGRSLATSESRPAHAGGSFDPSALVGGELGAGAPGPGTAPGGSPPGAMAPDVPPRIDQAARPVPLSGPASAPEAPQPPANAGASGAGSSAATGSGRMIPPMMMLPMAPGAGRTAAGRSGSARSLEDTERTAKKPAAAPGVPARLRGRSAVGDPAASGVRPIATSGSRHSTPQPAEQYPLDREVWQVTNIGGTSPLQPQAVQEPPRVRRRRQ